MERGTGPIVPPEPLIHEPWPDEEAEVLALYMSGQMCAPQVLYERVQKDLAYIREQWGDSIPRLRSIKVLPRFWAGMVNLLTLRETFWAMRDGAYHAWDSLNESLWIDTILYADYGPVVDLRSRARLNGFRLTTTYERLPGVRIASGIYTTHPEIAYPNLYAYQIDAGPRYLFYDPARDWPLDCSGLVGDYWYFRSARGHIEYVGHYYLTCPRNRIPSWWTEAYQAESQFFSGDEAFRTRDTIPPAAITDLAASSCSGMDAILTWTAPGGDGREGQAYTYSIEVDTVPITSENWYKTRRHYWSTPDPGPPGSPEIWTIRFSEWNSTHYVAIRTRDGRGNMSRISNVVSCRFEDRR